MARPGAPPTILFAAPATDAKITNGRGERWACASPAATTMPSDTRLEFIVEAVPALIGYIGADPASS